MDYSMSCPSITVINADQEFTFENCRVYYLSEKLPKPTSNIVGTRLADYSNNEQRFDMISNWAISCIIDYPGAVYIEDYSFGSKGKTFHIAENAGLAKHKVWKLGRDIHPIPPTVIKKFATGKGNATKDQMYEAFVKETGVDLMSIYQPKAKAVGSPVGDIVDSFYIAKFGYHERHK